jgi:Na+/melibiose symporter-like transporter
MIPIFSGITGHTKSWYSYIFIVKTVAELTGGFLSKFFAARVGLKDIYSWFTYLLAFSYICFYLSFEDSNIIIWYFSIAVGTIVMSIMGMSSIISVF